MKAGSFQLMGHTINVRYCDKILIDHDNTGEAHFRQNLIKLDCSQGRPDSKTEHIFLHELVHFIFYFLGEDKLREDENLVDTFAGLLHQALSTMEYE